MKNSTKKAILKTPGVGSLARATKHFLSLPSYKQTQEERLIALQSAFEKALEQLVRDNAKLAASLQGLQAVQDNMLQQLALLEKPTPKLGINTKSSAKLFADDHVLDVFYTNFEDRFRGSQQEIARRLEVYLPYFKESKLDFDKTPVLDLGSGRGEFLDVMRKANIKARGLDINLDMVKRANKLGFETVQGDALSYLQSAKSQSLGAVTGFHIAEHIPFGDLFRLFQAVRRVLVPGGFLIFETPNPENLVVGSHNFYMDPSHLHPLPPALLEFTLQTCGYSNVSILRLHPDKLSQQKDLPKEVKMRLFGPRDYAVIAYK